MVGETFCVSYVVLREPEDPGGDPKVGIIHQEEHDTPYEAGKAFGRMRALAPERKKERPPSESEADPIERLAWEQDVERARMDLVRMRVAIESNHEMTAE